MIFWHGIILGVAISAFIVLVATLVSRDPEDRAPATRAEIKRDRKRRIADITRARRATEPSSVDDSDERLVGEIAKLGENYQPPAGWQDRAIAAARWQPCRTCGLWMSPAHNARVMIGVGVVCVACATGKERPRG